MTDMNSRNPLDKPAVRAAFLVEAVPYFLLGCAIFGAGLVAIVLWSTEQWRLGHHREVLLACALGSMSVIGFCFATRAGKRVLSVAFGLTFCGFLVFLLFGLGVKIPLAGL